MKMVVLQVTFYLNYKIYNEAITTFSLQDLIDNIYDEYFEAINLTGIKKGSD